MRELLSWRGQRHIVRPIRPPGNNWLQALLTDGSEAEASYVESISQLGRSRAAVDPARAHLQYGQRLRRAKRRRDARHQLRTAEDMFHAMSAASFAEQARSELRATGERARARRPETELDLTPQEARVANLAARGSTNSEIAGQLFISPSSGRTRLAVANMRPSWWRCGTTCRDDAMPRSESCPSVS
jgi:ATP/maltotriose-dependent transcriptional regulator MalT